MNSKTRNEVLVGLCLLFAAVLCRSAHAQPGFYSPPTPKPYYLVAASNAPARIKSMANYVCDGVDDHVQIQAAIDACLTYPAGGEVVLSNGTFNCGGSIVVRGALTIRGAGVYSTFIYMRGSTSDPVMNVSGIGTAALKVGGSGYAVGDVFEVTGGGGSCGTFQVATVAAGVVQTFTRLSSGTGYAEAVGAATTKLTGSGDDALTVDITALCNEDLFVQKYTTEGFFTLYDLYIDGAKMAAASVGGVTYLGAFEQITGIRPYGNTSPNTDSRGRLYAAMTDDDATHHTLRIYKDAAKTALVAHTASFLDSAGPAMIDLVADNDSGIGGKIGLLVDPAASTDYDIALVGNVAGSAVNSAGWDVHTYDVMVMNTFSHGWVQHQGWGFVCDNLIVEFCGGHGVYLSGASASGYSKIQACKFKDNSGSGLYIANGAASCMVTNCEMSGGNQLHLGLSATPSPALALYSPDNAVSNCVFDVKGIGRYGAYTASTTGIRNTFSGCQFMGNTFNSGVGLYAAGPYTSVSGSSFYRFSGTSASGAVGVADKVNVTGCQFATCTNGVLLSAVNRCVVTGCQFSTLTGTGVTCGAGDGNVVNACMFDACLIGVSTANGAEHVTVIGNHFNIGTNGIVLAAAATAGSGLIASNTFIGQTGAAISDSSSTAGLFNIQGNNGAPNYRAGMRVAYAVDHTITDAEMSQVIVVTADAKVMTLPAAAAGKRVRIVNGGKDGAVLVNVDPADASTVITFRGADGGAGKSLLNTKATAKSGDFIDLSGIDATHWTVIDSAGAWAAEE